MDFKKIQVDIQDKMALITLNRPEVLNAIDPEMWLEIKSANAMLEADADVRVIVFRGAGEKAFAAGADIRMLRERPMMSLLNSPTNNILHAMTYSTKPVIAAINGFALGGGCELALACDIRIATTRSRLGLPETTLGIIPGGGGTQRLQRLVGTGMAKKLIFTGEIINAQEAYRIGLVDQLVETDKSDELMAAVRELADKIIARSPVAIELAKTAINVAADSDLYTGLTFERYAEAVAFATEDRIEGTSAFLEKRPPDFRGK